jgi:hypothetical protein
MNVKLFFIVGEEAVGLVSSVVLGAESPVNVWKYGLLFEVYCAEDTAAYFRSLLSLLRSREKRGLSAFSTYLAKKHGKRDFSPAISPFLPPCFCCDRENNEAI